MWLPHRLRRGRDRLGPLGIVLEEGFKFLGMVPVRLLKLAGWILEWPLGALGSIPDGRSVFILAVPRSGSTLLYNLIAWNGNGRHEVLGYGENKASYRSERDLRRLRVRTMLYRRSTTRNALVADKIVRSECRLGEGILADERCSFIFLTRDDASVAASLERELGLSPSASVAHLAARSAALASMWAVAANRLEVRYEDLVTDPVAVLAEVAAFLGLGEPLCEHYRVPPNAYNFAFGDNGRRIKAGRVLAPPPAGPGHGDGDPRRR